MNRIRFYREEQWYEGFYICDSTLTPDRCYVEDLQENIYLIDKEDMQVVTFLAPLSG
jgi:hypothetical protein